jgi:hypothetical protein
MPLIGGPITFFLALDHGAAFAARSATLTLAAICGQAAHLLAFTYLARVTRWPWALAAGWSSFVVASLIVAWAEPRPAVALVLALASLFGARLALPAENAVASHPSVPPIEMRMRLVSALALAALILWSAARFGPVVSGLLLSLPVTGSIMPPFTLSLYGADAVARLARGFLVGLTGFTAFFFVVATTLVAWGAALSFASAIAAALAAVALAVRVPAQGAKT